MTLSGKTLTIANPEIVNGLQTSREIYNFFAAGGGADEERNLLIRVIVPSATESRYHIIRATNSQTIIAAASLRATDLIHREIEEYLRTYGIFYDRRKNCYKNQGKSIRSIIGISQLAQAVAAIVLQRPDNARARPSSLIKDDVAYRDLFNREYPIEVYRACVEIIKTTEAFLSKHTDRLTAAQRNDLKYYVAMSAATILTGAVRPSTDQVAALAGSDIKESALEQAYQATKAQYDRLGADDTVAKGTEMLSNVVAKITQGELF